MQLSPVRTIRLDLVRPMRSAAAHPNGLAYGTTLLVLSLMVTMFLASAGILRFQGMIDALALQSTTWSWSDPLSYGRLFSYALLHGSASHFFWNSLLLVLVGSVVEWRLGLRVTLGLFVAGAVVAALAHLLIFPSEPRTLIGASGAISALLGAALIVAGDLGLKVRLPGPDRWFALTMRRLLVLWLALQIVSVLLLLSPGQGQVSIAYWAHIVGFVCGVCGVFVCRRLGVRVTDMDLEPDVSPAFAGAGD